MTESFSQFITEEPEEQKYKLLILSHDDPLDPNETGPMIRKIAAKMGIQVYLAEFSAIRPILPPGGCIFCIFNFRFMILIFGNTFYKLLEQSSCILNFARFQCFKSAK